MFVFSEPLIMYSLLCFQKFVPCLISFTYSLAHSLSVFECVPCFFMYMGMLMKDYYCLVCAWLKYRWWGCRLLQGKDWWEILRGCNRILLLVSVGLPKIIISCFGMLLSLGAFEFSITNFFYECSPLFCGFTLWIIKHLITI